MCPKYPQVIFRQALQVIIDYLATLDRISSLEDPSSSEFQEEVLRLRTLLADNFKIIADGQVFVGAEALIENLTTKNIAIETQETKLLSSQLCTITKRGVEIHTISRLTDIDLNQTIHRILDASFLLVPSSCGCRYLISKVKIITLDSIICPNSG